MSEETRAVDEARIDAADIREALTRASFAYTDGTAQVFTPDGRTTFVEHGETTTGDWGVDERGRFWSFWPPDYRAEYEVFWLVEDGTQVGVRFAELRRGGISEGRYAS